MNKYFNSVAIWVILPALYAASYANATQGLLEPANVRVVMGQMLAYHVDHNAMTPELIKRALRIYVEQFDQERVYLLDSEADPYMNASDALAEEVLNDYNHDKFTHFETLQGILQAAILRSRKWRAEMQQNPSGLVSESKDFPETKGWDKRPFAKTEDELKDRTLQHQLHFFDAQRKRLGPDALLGKDAQLCAFYERARRSEENQYLYLVEGDGKLSPQEQTDQFLTFVLKSLAKSLDAHSAFFSQREAYDMKVRLQKDFKGVGIVLEEALEGVTITRIIEGGPAAAQGQLKAKDRIVSVDGVSVVDYTFDKVLDLIRGDEGSTVALGIERGAGDQISNFTVKLVRAPVLSKEDRVDYTYVKEDDGIIGTINLHSFYEGANGVSAVRDVRDAIRDLSKVGPLKGLVIDMRLNTGGFLMQAVKVAGLFVTNGPIVTAKYAGGETRVFRDIDGYSYFEGPIVILTSRLSASAAEIVAQALQDYGVALIVGDKTTYGKGSIQHQTVTDDHSPWFFKVTVGRYYTPSGHTTQLTGVQADILVPGPLAGEELGEAFQEYPLSADSIPPDFNDNLGDLDVNAQQWYQQHYIPSLQHPLMRWRHMIPELQKNSAQRLANNEKYAAFIKSEVSLEEAQFSKNPAELDPQVVEAVDIVKDMLRMDASHQPPETPSVVPEKQLIGK